MGRPSVRRTNLPIALVLSVMLTQVARPAPIHATLLAPGARKPAPVFRLLDASGKTIRLSDYRGKVVLLNFWATECGGCRLELPSFIELDQAHKGEGLVVVGVSMDVSYESLKNAQEGWSRVRPFVAAKGIKYPILMADDDAVKRYNIEALPVTHLIDAKGRIAATYVGIVDKKDAEANIEALLKER
jgi:peroxiredoxin